MKEKVRERLNPKIGLCEICAHSRTIKNARGNDFYLCKLSETDSRFDKYPRLPVLSCDGFVKRSHPNTSPQSSRS